MGMPAKPPPALRVGLVVPGFSAGEDDWAIPALQSLAVRLAQTARVTVFSQRYPAKGAYAFGGLTHLALGGGQKPGLGSLRLWLQTVQAIVSRHRQTPFDLLHAFWADEAGFAAVLAGAIIRRPVIVSIGGWELTNLPDIDYGAQRIPARRATVKMALKWATAVTAGSAYQRDLCLAHAVPASKLHLAPLGVDTDHFRPDDKDKSYLPPTIVQAASLIPVKDQALLLQVMALVREKMPGARLNLAGTGPLEPDLKDLARRLGLEPAINWQRALHRELPNLYRQSDLYLQTSRHESQGMAVLEAMACGLPLIGTPVGVARDVACLPAQESAGMLAGQAVQILSERAAYPGRARAIVEREFSLDVALRNFLNIYRTVGERG